MAVTVLGRSRSCTSVVTGRLVALFGIVTFDLLTKGNFTSCKCHVEHFHDFSLVRWKHVYDGRTHGRTDGQQWRINCDRGQAVDASGRLGIESILLLISQGIL